MSAVAAIILASVTDAPAWVIAVVLLQFIMTTLVSIALFVKKRSDDQEDQGVALQVAAVRETIGAKLDALKTEVEMLRDRDARYERNFEHLRERDRQIELNIVTRLTAIETRLASRDDDRAEARRAEGSGS